jgi:hypothetical protein
MVSCCAIGSDIVQQQVVKIMVLQVAMVATSTCSACHAVKVVVSYAVAGALCKASAG